MVHSTYNTPTIITWIGPWRYVILCINLYFSSLCMMMGRMADGRRRKGSKEEEDNLKNSKECLHTHSWCCHGDPRDDHLGNAFYCRFLQEGYKTRSEFMQSNIIVLFFFNVLKFVQTVEWPSLLPFSSVTAMPFRISLKTQRKQKTFNIIHCV